ncbi:hypothetical protein FBZ89_1384 [Nitrospirillum amazonense]|uniref:Uncharacterized protein n=1 Tax=Nitrospirillum amazonense TaxID=28077 RepID=A0A560EJZ6_9PROT|nr:hypothetical protein [Nitrospirillum amazonense]TWB09703.1 hypothetical protein FBZ89_1384 [Nitrospirillum amazonense]
MVNRLIHTVVAIMVISPQIATAKVKTIDIKSVSMETKGIFEGDEKDKAYTPNCDTRELTNGKALKWFGKSHEEPGYGFNEKATVTGCVFKGHLTTADGRTLEWKLDVGGTGYILLSGTDNKVLQLIGPEIPR